MLLMPQQDWQWSYNDTYNLLSVSLGAEMEFLTPYHKKLLIPDALVPTEFSLEQAKFYIAMVERLQNNLSLSNAALVQIALNATAAHFMLRPQMPKSWYFEVSDVCVYCEVGKLFELLSLKKQRVQVLVVENALQAAQVMLLSNRCELTDDKTMSRFDTIKVMHNRLLPIKFRLQAISA
ncbi:MAG: cell division protein ZapC [Shewanella sp.]|nr:cell division protein ZapC [Shewanella sp.]MCF1430436.1 cell division protein ZapC [Shewanella sp.]MCF1456930.1 cell division protein ZapC [Shewanella sp.]